MLTYHFIPLSNLVNPEMLYINFAKLIQMTETAKLNGRILHADCLGEPFIITIYFNLKGHIGS